MNSIKIEPSSEGKLWVTLPYSEIGVARLKKIPGHRWNPERKQWQLPDTQETRAVLAEIVALKPESRAPILSVAPRRDGPLRQARARYVPGKSKPLTTNPPHPLIKQVDDELVLRGMAYGTRKSYGQHLRNYFDWLTAKNIAPAAVSKEEIRSYLVELATGGRVSAAYCCGARAAKQCG